MQPIAYVVDYDENSCAWLVPVSNPSYRVALHHGMVVHVLFACPTCDSLPCVCVPAARLPPAFYCPHDRADIASSEEGTHYCGACAREAQAGGTP